MKNLELWQICLGIAVFIIVTVTVGIRCYGKYRKKALLEIWVIKTSLRDLAGDERALECLERYMRLSNFYGILPEEIGFHDDVEPYILATDSMRNCIVRAVSSAKEVEFVLKSHEDGSETRSRVDLEYFVTKRDKARKHIEELQRKLKVLEKEEAEIKVGYEERIAMMHS